MKKAFVKQVAVGVTVLAVWELVLRPGINMIFQRNAT